MAPTVAELDALDAVAAPSTRGGVSVADLDALDSDQGFVSRAGSAVAGAVKSAAGTMADLGARIPEGVGAVAGPLLSTGTMEQDLAAMAPKPTPTAETKTAEQRPGLFAGILSGLGLGPSAKEAGVKTPEAAPPPLSMGERVLGAGVGEQVIHGVNQALTLGFGDPLLRAVGLPVTEPPKDVTENIAYGVGHLAGFMGTPYAIGRSLAEATLGRQLAPLMTDTARTVLGKAVIKEAATLAGASAASEAGHAYEKESVLEGAKVLAKAAGRGALTGAVFGGVSGTFTGTDLPGLAARWAVGYGLNEAVNLQHPFDERPLAEKIFDAGLAMLFLFHARDPRLVLEGLKREAKAKGIPLDDAVKLAMGEARAKVEDAEFSRLVTVFRRRGQSQDEAEGSAAQEIHQREASRVAQTEATRRAEDAAVAAQEGRPEAAARPPKASEAAAEAAAPSEAVRALDALDRPAEPIPAEAPGAAAAVGETVPETPAPRPPEPPPTPAAAAPAPSAPPAAPLKGEVTVPREMVFENTAVGPPAGPPAEGPAARVKELQDRLLVVDRILAGKSRAWGTSKSERPMFQQERENILFELDSLDAPHAESATREVPAGSSEIALSQTTQPTRMWVTLGKERYAVSSFEEASTKFRQVIKGANVGVSDTPPAVILDDAGNVVGNITYNGKVLPGRPGDWKPGTKPLYNPFDADPNMQPTTVSDFQGQMVTVTDGPDRGLVGRVERILPHPTRGEALPILEIRTQQHGSIQVPHNMVRRGKAETPPRVTPQVPRFEQTAAGSQGVIEGAPTPTVPTTAIRRGDRGVSDLPLVEASRETGRQVDLPAGEVLDPQRAAVQEWLTDQLGSGPAMWLARAKSLQLMPKALRAKLQSLGIDPADAWDVTHAATPKASSIDRLVAKSMQGVVPALPASVTPKPEKMFPGGVAQDYNSVNTRDPLEVDQFIRGVGGLNPKTHRAELEDAPLYLKNNAAEQTIDTLARDIAEAQGRDQYEVANELLDSVRALAGKKAEAARQPWNQPEPPKGMGVSAAEWQAMGASERQGLWEFSDAMDRQAIQEMEAKFIGKAPELAISEAVDEARTASTSEPADPRIRILQTPEGEPIARLRNVDSPGRGMGTWEVEEWIEGSGASRPLPFGQEGTYGDYFRGRVADKLLFSKTGEVSRQGAKLGYLQTASADAKYLAAPEGGRPTDPMAGRVYDALRDFADAPDRADQVIDTYLKWAEKATNDPDVRALLTPAQRTPGALWEAARKRVEDEIATGTDSRREPGVDQPDLAGARAEDRGLAEAATSDVARAAPSDAGPPAETPPAAEAAGVGARGAGADVAAAEGPRERVARTEPPALDPALLADANTVLAQLGIKGREAARRIDEALQRGMPESAEALVKDVVSHPEFGEGNVIFSKAAADAAKDRIAERLKGGTLTTGIDPSLLKDYVQVGGYYIEGGVRTFAEWSKRMIGDFGEGVKKDLDEVWGLLQREPSVKALQTQGPLRGVLAIPKAMREWLAPQTVTPEAAKMGRNVSARAATMHLARERAEYALRTYKREFDRKIAEVGGLKAKDPRLTPEQRANVLKPVLDLMDYYETGRVNPDVTLRDVDRVLREAFVDRREKLVARGILNHTVENYFGRFWETPREGSVTGRILGKRPLAGPESFRKERFHETYRDGIEAGKIPVIVNPVEMALAKLFEEDRSIAGHDMFNEGKQEGYIRFFREGEHPEDWTKIDDKIARVRQYSETEKGLVIRGDYYAPDAAATVLNNYLSPGIHPSLRPLNDIWRSFANSLNQAQLGVSGFHAGIVTAEGVINQVAFAIRQATAGHPLQALRTAATVSPTGTLAGAAIGGLLGGPAGAAVGGYVGGVTVSRFRAGSRMMREGLTPGSQGGEIADAVNLYAGAGGGRLRMGGEYRMARAGEETIGGGRFHQVHAFVQALRAIRSDPLHAGAGKYLRGTFGAVPAALELSMYPVMEWYVPRMKMGVSEPIIRWEMERMKAWEADTGHTIPEDTWRSVVGRVVNNADDRLGQLTYDNLHWNRSMKAILQGAVRAVGWNTGLPRQVGGGIADTAAYAKQVATGVPANRPWQGRLEMSDRMTWLFALPVIMGIYGTIYQKAAADKWPGEGIEEQGLSGVLRDLYVPRDGTTRDDGSPGRRVPASYMRDVVSFSRHPLTTVEHKLTPLLSTLAQMYHNEDFYGGDIVNTNDDVVQQAQDLADYLLKQYEPFSLRSAPQIEEQTTSGRLESYFGQPQAGATLTRDPEQQAAIEARQDRPHMRKKMRRDAEQPGPLRRLFGGGD